MNYRPVSSSSIVFYVYSFMSVYATTSYKIAFSTVQYYKRYR